MAQYRLTGEVHFNDPFKLISIQVTQDIGGESEERTVRKNQDLFSCLVPTGAVVEVPDTLIPGPHMEPIDDAAKAVMAAHMDQARPKFHNTLEGLPSTMDMRSSEEMIASAMETAISAAFKAGQKMSDAEPPKLSLGRK